MKNKEIERKFLIDIDKIPFDLSKMDYRDITQGYVTAMGGDEFTYRLRHVLYRSHLDGDLLGEEFSQTIKGKGSKIRDEYEIKLWKNQFSKLWRLCDEVVVHKFRYELPTKEGQNRRYLDVYKNSLRGLYTIEVEFESEEACDNYIPPEWFGEEVTENVNYCNFVLASKGLPQ